jgi:putative transposase
MTYDPREHNRRSTRLQGWDYTQPGWYFVTIGTAGRRCLFGEIMDGMVYLSRWGEIAAQCWKAIPEHFPRVSLDEWIVMPNHIHGIVIILGDTRYSCANRIRSSGVGADHNPPLRPPQASPGSLGVIMRQFKGSVTRRINEIRHTPGASVWQRNYHDHSSEMTRIWNAYATISSTTQSCGQRIAITSLLLRIPDKAHSPWGRHSSNRRWPSPLR